MIQQDIERRRGLCLIDPHGTLVTALVERCAAVGFQRFRRIHVVDPANADWSFGFNPLRTDGYTDIHTRVDTMVAACAEVWGGENINETPLLTTCLQLVFYALAARNLTLLEAIDLTASKDPHRVRRTLTQGLPDTVYDSYWAEIGSLPRREFEERFSSVRRRLLRFLGSPIVRRMVGQRSNVLDVRQAMDDGDIILMNLKEGGSFSKESARLLGTLLASELFLVAKTRDERTAMRRPFTLYIDECYDYVTQDVEHMLAQTRKFGLHAVLAHQYLAELGDPDMPIYRGVMAGAQTKIVFGNLDDDDADVMARQIYRSTFNLERPKHVLDKPIVVGEVIDVLHSESATISGGKSRDAGTSRGLSTSQGESWGSSETDSRSNAHARASSRTSMESVLSGESLNPEDGAILNAMTGATAGIRHIPIGH